MWLNKISKQQIIVHIANLFDWNAPFSAKIWTIFYDVFVTCIHVYGIDLNVERTQKWV